jgi:predicted Zn-dependent protease
MWNPKPAIFRRPARWFLLAAMLPAVAGVTGCSKSKDLFRPSDSQQKEVGAKAAEQVAKEYKIIGGAPKDRVQAVGSRLVAALPDKERTTWNYQFNVIESKEINAFALPGGPIYIFTGLLNKLTEDDELAGVLGHEMTHVHGEHWANQVAADQERVAGLSILLGATGASNAAYTAAGVVNSLVNLRYSRKDEDQADEGGLETMVAAGYDPRGMLKLFKVLEEAGGGGSTPAFLLDHPLTQDRIRHTEERIAKIEAEKK